MRKGLNQFTSLFSALLKNTKFPSLSTSKFAALGPTIWKSIRGFVDNISKDIEPKEYMLPDYSY
jgi:hypothetical protein